MIRVLIDLQSFWYATWFAAWSIAATGKAREFSGRPRFPLSWHWLVCGVLWAMTLTTTRRVVFGHGPLAITAFSDGWNDIATVAFGVPLAILLPYATFRAYRWADNDEIKVKIHDEAVEVKISARKND